MTELAPESLLDPQVLNAIMIPVFESPTPPEVRVLTLPPLPEWFMVLSPSQVDTIFEQIKVNRKALLMAAFSMTIPSGRADWPEDAGVAVCIAKSNLEPKLMCFVNKSWYPLGKETLFLPESHGSPIFEMPYDGKDSYGDGKDA